MELSDFIFGHAQTTPVAASDGDVLDYLRYAVTSEARRYLGAPFAFLPEGRFIAEIADIRKGCSAGGRPYLAIELIVLESTTDEAPVGFRGQLMYMLDKEATSKQALGVFRELYQRSDITEDDVAFAVRASARNLDSSPFAGATLGVSVSATKSGFMRSEMKVWV